MEQEKSKKSTRPDGIPISKILEKEKMGKASKDDIHFELIENFEIPLDSIVTTEETSMKIWITHAKKPIVCCNKNLKNKTYFNMYTGETKKYKFKEKKDIESIRRSMRRLKKIIELNFDQNTNFIFFTLTYDMAIAPTDLDRVKKDVKNFLKKINYRLRNMYDLAYIEKFEIQRNGNWHIHGLIKDVKNKEFDTSFFEIIPQLWEKGKQVDVQIVNSNGMRLKLGKKEVELNDNDSIEKLASYLAKISCFKDNKMDIKSGERLFISSKNIEKPIKTTNVILKEVLEKLESENAFLEKEISFELYNGSNCLNTFNKRLYNKNNSCNFNNKSDLKNSDSFFEESKIIENPAKINNFPIEDELENLKPENEFLKKEISFEKHKCHFWLNTFIRKLNKKIIKITERIKMKFFSS